MRWSKPARKMSLSVIMISLVFIAGGAVFYRSAEALAFSAAVILMAALNIAKVRMIEHTVHKTTGLEEPAHGKNYARLQYMARLACTAAVLIAAALFANRTGMYGSVWGGIAGVLTFQIAAFSLRFFGLNEDEKEGD